MPTKNPRFTVALPEELLAAVVDYQHRHKIKTQNLAINELIRNGMGAIERELGLGNTDTSSDVSKRAMVIAVRFDQLDTYGKDAVSAIVDAEYRRCKNSEIVETSVRQAIQNGEKEEDIAKLIDVFSRASQGAREQAISLLSDDDTALLKKYGDEIIEKYIAHQIKNQIDSADA